MLQRYFYSADEIIAEIRVEINKKDMKRIRDIKDLSKFKYSDKDMILHMSLKSGQVLKFKRCE